MIRVVMVTGAAGGIGRAAVSAFAESGWQVAAVDRMAMEGNGHATRSYSSDVSKPEEVEDLFRAIRSDFGRLDALVNNAAVQVSRLLLDTSAGEWDEVMASNLRSAFLTARYGHVFLRESHGSIVNVSSVHAMASSSGVAAYAASKGGLVALTRVMAIEFGPDQIRVNAILPGAVDTPMLRAGLDRGHLPGASSEERLAELGRRTLLGRIGRPAEVGQAILFFADGERSSYTTGQTLIVDGGAMARLSTE